MYERTFGTDWDSLSDRAALRRMYALGVATALGDGDDDEYDRLRAQGTTPYVRSVLELAFEEGHAHAAGTRSEYDDAVDAWEDLVEDSTPPRSTRPDGLAKSDATPLPRRLSRTSVLDITRDELDRLRLPELLRRDR